VNAYGVSLNEFSEWRRVGLAGGWLGRYTSDEELMPPIAEAIRSHAAMPGRFVRDPGARQERSRELRSKLLLGRLRSTEPGFAKTGNPANTGRLHRR
jgi:hypothetical protein